MIEVDYTNYCSIQAEWAAGLLRAAGHLEFMPEGYCEDMTAIAKGIQARLTDGRHTVALPFRPRLPVRIDARQGCPRAQNNCWVDIGRCGEVQQIRLVPQYMIQNPTQKGRVGDAVAQVVLV